MLSKKKNKAVKEYLTRLAFQLAKQFSIPLDGVTFGSKSRFYEGYTQGNIVKIYLMDRYTDQYFCTCRYLELLCHELAHIPTKQHGSKWKALHLELFKYGKQLINDCNFIKEN